MLKPIQVSLIVFFELRLKNGSFDLQKPLNCFDAGGMVFLGL